MIWDQQQGRFVRHPFNPVEEQRREDDRRTAVRRLFANAERWSQQVEADLFEPNMNEPSGGPS